MLAIKMSNDLTGRTIPGTFKEVVDAIQLVKAQGRDFLILEKEDGNNIAFHLENLNSIEETDDAF